jgi:hypothetical protein
MEAVKIIEKRNKQSMGYYTLDGLVHLSRQLDSLNKLYLLLKYDNNKESLNSLYHMYIYSLCSFCECLLRTTFDSTILKNWNDIKDHHHHLLIDEARKSLESLSWENLRKKELTFLGVEIPNEIKESESFKTISIMFRLRNLLIHGSNFQISLMSDYENENLWYEITGQAQGVYEFLIEKKLIFKNELKNLGHYELTSTSIFYFISNVLEFTVNYSKFLNSLTGYDYYKEFTNKGIFNEGYKILKE